MMTQGLMPSFEQEHLLAGQGYRLVAGVDEAGRGALMGPVVAGAVVMPEDFAAHWLHRVRDSKKLKPAVREELFGYIRKEALSVGTGVVSSRVIDERGILVATKLAMKAAIEALSPPPQYLIIDYLMLPEVPLPQKGITGGDSLCFSIACASIIAKVTRDRIVCDMERDYPGYGFSRHKGYGTKEHIDCLRRRGPCEQHRRSFRPVSDVMNGER